MKQNLSFAISVAYMLLKTIRGKFFQHFLLKKENSIYSN